MISIKRRLHNERSLLAVRQLETAAAARRFLMNCTAAQLRGNIYVSKSWYTRKLYYRKDDRAMRPIYIDALKICGSPWLRPRLLFSKLLMGFCCDRSYVPVCAYRTYRYIRNFGSSWIRPRPLFSKSFNGLLFRWTLRMYYQLNLKSVALPALKIIGGSQKFLGRRGSEIVPLEGNSA